jgi:hypothetical protein
MATVVAPAYGSNNANQNAAQPILALVPVPPTPLTVTVLAAPSPTAVFLPSSAGYPIG